MPKTYVTAIQRVREFPTDYFVAEKGKLLCTLCSECIHFEKKSIVQKHIESFKHRSRKQSDGQGSTSGGPSSLRTSTIPQVWQRMEKSKDNIKEMVEAFTSAGIPLHVFRNLRFRQWITTATCIQPAPSETTLRRYLAKCAEDDFQETKSKCEGNSVYLVVDETTDSIKNRKVVNVLVAPLGVVNENPRLVKTKIVEHCNADVIVNLILDALDSIGVHRSNFIVLISDSAPYMLSAGRRLAGVAPQLLHSTCWAHILHLCAEEIRSSLNIADEFIAAVKTALTKTPARRERLLDCLNEAGTFVLPPVPVITRWGTWLKAGKFHYINFNAVKHWIDLEDGEGSAAVTNLKRLVENKELVLQLEAISEISDGLCNQIKTLESDNQDATQVWLRLSSVLQIIQSSGATYKKLAGYMSERHPALNFWKEVQNLDPTLAVPEKISSIFTSGELKRFSTIDVPVEEISTYAAMVHGQNLSSSSALSFWQKHSTKMPILSKLAMKAIMVPPSSASVERSFSTLKWILNSKRSCLTEENLQFHLQLAFNQKQEGVDNMKSACDSDEDD